MRAETLDIVRLELYALKLSMK